jgi:predicted RNase H-like nuclease (RuvC/YqgF family)
MVTYTLDALKNTEKKFMELLRNLRKKIEKLEKEKAGLLAEIDGLKEKGEAKAHELENEVTILRKEVKTLEKLLNAKEKTRNKEIQNKDFS